MAPSAPSLLDLSPEEIPNILHAYSHRLKEAYEEGSISAPSVDAISAPSQVRPILDQIAGVVAGLPAQIKSLVEGPLTIPLTNTYERLLLITYLDDELLVSPRRLESSRSNKEMKRGGEK